MTTTERISVLQTTVNELGLHVAVLHERVDNLELRLKKLRRKVKQRKHRQRTKG